MNYKPTIDIMLHPLAWHALRRDFPFDGTAVDLGRSWAYNIITQGLQRSYKAAPWEFSRQREAATYGKIYITQYNAERYGLHMSLTRQANFSCIIYRLERQRLCQLTAYAHVMGGFSRDAAMRHFLDIDDITDQEITFQSLRKYYQRNYRQNEELIRQSISILQQD